MITYFAESSHKAQACMRVDEWRDAVRGTVCAFGEGQWGFRLCSAEKEEYANLPEGTSGLKIRLDRGARRGENA